MDVVSYLPDCLPHFECLDFDGRHILDALNALRRDLSISRFPLFFSPLFPFPFHRSHSRPEVRLPSPVASSREGRREKIHRDVLFAEELPQCFAPPASDGNPRCTLKEITHRLVCFTRPRGGSADDYDVPRLPALVPRSALDRYLLTYVE